ncbi:MAG TPA: DUF3107 domain-containing protein [Actinopolymorphaceae bacterium]|jgi:hypothetical protein
MEIKIGIVDTARELTIDSTEAVDVILKAVTDAILTGGLLVLTDSHERKVLVPGAKLAYVDLGDPRERRVGFGAA